MISTFDARIVKARKMLAEATARVFPYPFRPALTGRPASVLILCGAREEGAGLEILVTRRTESLETHKGQYAFPGGMRDSESETVTDTALRETEEEVGIKRADIETFGTLPPIWTPSGFLVTPVVGLLTQPIEAITITPSTAEIDLWFWCKLEHLREPGIHSTEARKLTFDGAEHTVVMDVYQVEGHRIWGVTGAMLHNFLGRLGPT